MKIIANKLFKFRGFIPLPFITLMLYYFNGNAISMFLGFLILGIGELIRIWGVSYAGEITRTTIRLRADSLVKDGPFSYVRNPIYMGNIIIFLGFGIFTMALFPYLQIFMVLWFILQYRLIIVIEEEFLEHRFQEEYWDYKNNVPRFFPNLVSSRKLPVSGKIPDYQNAIKSETRTFQALLSIGMISIIIYLVK